MESSDDEVDAVTQSVSNYYFLDDKNEPISFCSLPIQLTETEGVDDKKRTDIFLHGAVDNGLQKICKEVMAWKFDLTNATPDIFVLTKDNSCIKLGKPRKSFEETIRTALITVQCLHFARRNPEASGKSVWDHLSRAFRSLDVRPSQDDLVDHLTLIQEAVKKDEHLAKCKFLLTFIEEKPRKRMLLDEDVQTTKISEFIVDNVVDEDDDGDEDCISEDEEVDSGEEGDLFDSVCAFCDNGGDLLCCEGRCMRSFHATLEAGQESICDSLGLTDEEVMTIENFICKNCKYAQHQCFSCGKLGSSVKLAGAEVFRCANATCGYFYHPHCVARLLYPNDENAALGLQKQIAAGESFACPIHKCTICKQGENKKNVELQFAVCRRCPTSYHRKCLPREIAFENLEEENISIRAWEKLLPNRILIYCLKHEIDEEFGTPARDHIKFPDIEEKEKRAVERPRTGGIALLKKRKLISEDSSVETTVGKATKTKKLEISKKNKNMSERLASLKKVGTNVVSRKSLKVNKKFISKEVTKAATAIENRTSLGDMLFDVMMKSSERGKHGKQDMLGNELNKNTPVKMATKSLSSELPALDSETERRVKALMKEAESSISLEDVIRKHEVPSTHTSSSRAVVDRTITLGKVEGAVEAARTALKKLERGCSLDDAKAVCEPEVLGQMHKWKTKLKVYLAPFIHGMRYSSYGRHFTKVDKLQEIAELLHWYVEDGDTIVDFCCGANDFSWIMKNKLEETGKKCFYRNYDFIQPKNDFNFERRDWMTVHPDELPTSGSRLIMGLNPPFGVQAVLANKFIDKALEFRPKLLILIVPPETERLDKKNPPYDLVWENDHFLSGKSFYLPGSIDQNDKQIEQSNLTPPLLYLWSRRDWTARHNIVARKHGHGVKKWERSIRDEMQNCSYQMDDHDSNSKASVLDDFSTKIKEAKNFGHGLFVGEGYGVSASRVECDAASHDSRGSVKSLSSETLKKRSEEKVGRGLISSSPGIISNDGNQSVSNVNNEMPPHRPSGILLNRSSQECLPCGSGEMASNAEASDNRYHHMEPGLSGSYLQYGTDYSGNSSKIHDDIRRYGLNNDEPYLHGSYRISGGTNWEEQYAMNMRNSGTIVDHGSYAADRDTDLQSQVHLYGRDSPDFRTRVHLYGRDSPDFRTRVHLYAQASDPPIQRSHPFMNDPGSSHIRPLSSVPPMDQYPSHLNELNHMRANNWGLEPPLANRNDFYASRSPALQPGYFADPGGFPSVPHNPYPHNSAGWLNE
ncbi:hypothetical protein K2173_015445 [Erythroxylum novogranatense]|uniref:Zinc finger PHD-type domain-containing protein n=1 Tax=Erythroxylum novogranatense TaxID=1862640 RepID=A0AAV8SRS5_9ROSI|nr:hypothetical protein K2173_015445 [Erythroxylum novogranatense]